MANLYQRIFVPSDDYEKIPVHGFYSAISDAAGGYSTKAEIVVMFDLDAQASANLDALIAKYQASTEKDRWLHEFHAIMMMSEAGLKYITQATFLARLGL